MLKYLQIETRQALLPAALITFLAVIAAAVLSLAAISYSNRAASEAFAGVVGVVVQEYPQAEAGAISLLRSPDSAAVDRGHQILSRYNLDQRSILETSISAALTRAILPASLIFTALICLAFTVHLIRCQQRVTAQVEGLSVYLRRLERGDYGLDIRDNGEGRFSLLKNDLYKVTVRMREQAEGLQKDKQLLADAIADISHQLKTPLTSLSVMTDLLSADPPEADRRAFVEQLRPQLDRMQWLVTALLKLARLDAGTAELKQERVNLYKLVDRAAAPLQIAMELQNVRLELSGDEQAAFHGDANWSAEAVTNILKNCLEHTSPGGKIQVTCAANPLYAALTICDSGEGILPEDLPHIFTRFYRGKNASENSIGIGLALANAIFQAQNGEIAVQSEPGQGTCFEVKIFRAAA